MEMDHLRKAALIAVAVGAAGSVGSTLRACRHNHSRILIVLFVLWVLSPFVALVWAYGASNRWPISIRRTLYGVVLVITAGSLALYGEVAFGPPRAQTASVFVVVPPASWLLIAMAIAISTLLRRGKR